MSLPSGVLGGKVRAQGEMGASALHIVHASLQHSFGELKSRSIKINGPVEILLMRTMAV